MKLIKNTNTNLLSRYHINKLCSKVEYEGFKIEWMQKSIDASSNLVENMEQNFGARMNFFNALKLQI